MVYLILVRETSETKLQNSHSSLFLWKPYSFKQLSIHNQSFCDIMKIEKVYQSKTGEELQKWQ